MQASKTSINKKEVNVLRVVVRQMSSHGTTQRATETAYFALETNILYQEL